MAYNCKPVSKSHDSSFKRKKELWDMGMDVEQFKKILKAVKGLPWKEGGSHPRLASRDYLIFVILGNLGLRIGELVLLQKEHFQRLSANPAMAHVPALKKRDPDARKIIYVHPRVAKVIMDYIREEMAPNQKFLFPGASCTRRKREGQSDKIIEGHLSTRMVTRIFQTYVRLLGFKENYSPHCLRHMFGTLCYERTADPIFVRDQLGHAGMDGIGVTNRYISLSPARARKHIKAFGYLL